jgi:hypothetical protein
LELSVIILFDSGFPDSEFSVDKSYDQKISIRRKFSGSWGKFKVKYLEEFIL